MVCFVYISSQSRIFAHCLLYRDIILLLLHIEYCLVDIYSRCNAFCAIGSSLFHITPTKINLPSYPINDDNPMYKFGIDSAGQLSYYIK